jgi:hypothetical protein
MERHINTYQGLNKDTAYDSIQSELYIDAKDIRITTTNGESMGAFTNIKGNQEAFTIPNAYGAGLPFGPWAAVGIPQIIGYTTIRNRIVLFVADDSEANGWIYVVEYNTATREILPGFPVLKYYSPILNFSKKWPIEALGLYESNCIQKVYWTDYNNYFRSINLEDANLLTFPASSVDIFPDITYTQPLLKVIAGGGIGVYAGEYQVAYRLITSDGKETLVSPPSNLVHVVSDSETTQSAFYNGDLNATIDTGKSLSFQVDTSNYGDFNEIEFIVIYHSSQVSSPVVNSIEKISINNQTTISFTYTGNEGAIVPIELLTFTAKNNPFKTPKTITPKDSSLVIANIKSSTVSIASLLGPNETFDSRTNRFLNDGVTLPHPLTGNPEQIDEAKTKNAFNVSVDPSYSAKPSIGFNSDAHWDTEWQTAKQFKYKIDGATLGGDGPNISYEFHLEAFTLDSAVPGFSEGIPTVPNTPDFVLTHNLNDGYGTYENTTYPNFASPFLSGLMRGYKRGETYRFGIVLYTTKGEATFVEYIGDIKFPDISERNSTETIPGTGINYWPLSLSPADTAQPRTVGYSLGIKFNIDFSSCPLLESQIESYQIVRVQRQDADKRRYSQGLVKGFYFAPILEGDAEDFNLQINGSSNALHLYPYYPVDSGTNLSNATFATLEDQEYDPSPYTPVYADYKVKGQYLGFYSPDLSFKFGDSNTAMTALSNNPCMLVTGAYYDYMNSYIPIGGRDFSAQGLGQHCFDQRLTSRSTYPTSFNSIENIKQFADLTYMQMPDTASYENSVTSDYGGSYMRNYYAIDDYNKKPDVNLNKPQDGASNTDVPTINKAGTSIIGRIKRITIDPLIGTSVTPSAFDYFKAPYTNYIHVKTITSGAPNIGISDSTFPIIDYVLPKSEVYGGYNQSALETNIFIGASPVIAKTNLNPKVFGGDIFVNMFTLQTQTVDFNTDFYADNKYHQDNTETQAYPVETQLNLELAAGSTLRTEVKYTFSGEQQTHFRQETENSFTNYGKTSSLMYAYNNVYSRDNYDVTFFIEPVNGNNCSIKVNDVRAYLSSVKINGETIDSWTKFGANNYYDIDDYGPINKIINWKDTVHFVQDRGIGIYAINRAAVTTTADGVPTQLGTGLGFGKHQYFSKENGSIHQWGVKTTNSGLYIFDAIRRKLLVGVGGGQLTMLSEITGLHSLFQQLPETTFLRKENDGDNPILGKGITIGKDPINDEVIFTFLEEANYLTLGLNTTYLVGSVIYLGEGYGYVEVTTQFTTGSNKLLNIGIALANSVAYTPKNVSIVYDELAQKFSSIYSATPTLWIDNGDILLSPNPTANNVIYTHNIGNYGEFYDNVEEASVTLVINPQADINKILRTLEFNSIVRDDAKVIDRNITITAFRIQTQVQDTGKVLFSSGRIKRKFDKWRVKIPRDINTTNQKGRLRSSHFIVTLYFDNTANKQLIMNRLMSYFDYQIF